MRSLPHAHTVPSPKRARVGDSSLIINGELKYFQSSSTAFFGLVQAEGQAYFDRTRYISKLHELDDFILFCRPRGFGKSLTVSMLEHFYGLQYADEHQSLYKGLDVQKDIDERRVNPGQYFVLKFDFSQIRPRPDLSEANEELRPRPDLSEAKEELIAFLNETIKEFYGKYAAYLGVNFTDLCQNVDNRFPNLSLRRCARSVQYAIQQDERLAGIKGIYVLIDEYDSLPNRSFWATLKSLGTEGIIKKVFITGISPLSLSTLGSAFNVARNLSFHKGLAGLCGLTSSDLEDALMGIYEDPKVYDRFLSEMTEFYNGYHFCRDTTVKTVYNTETCLAYLQSRIEGVTPATQNPANS
ncbi:AAA-ATPase-like domain-containing protein [Terfezia claveryi]|nr:AAA-ATPase-like domain-containing protein [Terfezia claveryi]